MERAHADQGEAAVMLYVAFECVLIIMTANELCAPSYMAEYTAAKFGVAMILIMIREMQ
jgi:hypothetical protein